MEPQGLISKEEARLAVKPSTSISFGQLTIDQSTESVLKTLLGREILDLIGPSKSTKWNKAARSVELLALGLVAESKQRVFISLESRELPDGTDAFVLQASGKYEIRNYPRGPVADWDSISHMVPNFTNSRVNSLSIYASAYGSETYVEDTVEINLAKGWTLSLSASDTPLWIKLSLKRKDGDVDLLKISKKRVLRRNWGK